MRSVAFTTSSRPRYNQRTDEYGGSPANRMRLLREILEDTREVCDGKAAVACRITIDELLGEDGITRERHRARLSATSAEHPDLWDFVLGSWEDDSVTSRFGPEGAQEEYVRGLEGADHASRSWASDGSRRRTPWCARSNQGILDLIGAARPSIADPFLPTQDRGRPARGHSRVHRLQHLRVGRLHDVADPMHAEPDHG